MTHCTPEEARHIAGCMERGAEMRNMGAPALRSLADQVEVLTAEHAAVLRASLNSADLADMAMDDIKILTAERDALKVDAERYRWLRAGQYHFATARTILNDSPCGIDAAIDKLKDAK